MSRFFVDRPIFAAVISIVIVLAGLMAARVLPVAQYPEIAPPTVTITASLPGASAETLAKTVAAPIEEQLNGVEKLAYFSSSSSANGTVTISATFDVGTSVDTATINVNNRVKIAEPRLPEDVRRNGVVVQKRSNDILLVVAVNSPNKKHNTLFLSNYASLNVVDDLKRVPGVGDVSVFGAQDYGMRIWLRPDRMAQLGVTSAEVVNAIRAQNAQYAAGKIGQEPAPAGQAWVYTVTTPGRLVQPEAFGNIIVRAAGAQGVLRLRDVARIELGAQQYDVTTALDGQPTIGLAVYLQSGANALEVADAVRRTMQALQKQFPEGVSYDIPFDTTRFVQASIHEVVETLGIAALLVLGVVFLFLQNWRATLIPMVAVPVSLIGTLAGLWLFGFSLNTLTLFALVLAIGIVVDDAIVVLENVERLMHEQGLSPQAAAVESMREVAGAVVAIVLVLCAVFVPVAFLGGMAGKLYQQFAVTVAVAVVLSGVVALTLTPALCALLLRPTDQPPRAFAWFNRGFARLTRAYTGTVQRLLRHGLLGLLLLLVVVAASVGLVRRLPTGFVPPEDQGYLIALLMLPDAASLPRTQAWGAQFQGMVSAMPGVEHGFVVSGFDAISSGSKTNAGTVFIPLRPWSQRRVVAEDLAKAVLMKGMTLRDGMAVAFNPPAIRGLGASGGFEFYLQSRQDSDPQKLAQVLKGFTETLSQHKIGANPALKNIKSFFRPSVPQLRVNVDESKALSMGVALTDIYTTLQSTMGALYVNDFNQFGRTYKVQVQAEAAYRAQPEDLGRVYVRSSTGAQVPLSALIQVRTEQGAEQMERFNGFLAAKVMGEAGPEISSGEAIRLVEQLAQQHLPSGYQLAWTGQAFQEKQTSSASLLAFAFALVMVFLILAAQYEKWSLPLAVLLGIPFALLGALLAIWMRAMPNDIYFQIGLVVLIGLAAKNAILIVEFAAQKHAEGLRLADAALEAARLRFRPIVMTSLAFVLGVVPLVWASGAGAAARRSMGTGVFGGMLAATFVATLFVPLFYCWLAREHQTTDASKEAQ